MPTLVLCDDFWHPARTPRAGLKPLEDRGMALDWIEHAGDWSPERMGVANVTILTKSNNVSAADKTPWMNPEVQAAFRKYVRHGNGLLIIHSGSAGYHDEPGLRSLMGGVFTSHPPQCEVTVVPKADHPLASGATPFTLKDEHYHMELDDPMADVFLTTVSEHGSQPGGWTRSEGAGRVCMLTPGHNLEVWLHPSYQTLIANALKWCSGAG
jgi:type 1 glutamine amidotransferase